MIKQLQKQDTIHGVEGTIEFDKNYYKLNDIATVTLHDIDLEVFPYDINTIRLRVWSDTDTEGITLTSSYHE